MRKPIPLPFQRKMLYVPLLNGLILFFWIYNSILRKSKADLFFKSLFITLIRGVSVTVPLILLAYFINPLSWFFTAYVYASIYFVAYFVGNGLIDDQEKTG
jgi:hypothetical protein